MTLIEESAFLAARAADRAEAGSWPVAGGWLDQTQSCVDAVTFFQKEDGHWRAKLSIPDDD